MCGLSKPVGQRHRLQRCRIAVKLVANQISCVAVYPERPWGNLDSALLNAILHRNLIIAIMPRKDVDLAFGSRLKPEIKSSLVTQIGDAVDPLK